MVFIWFLSGFHLAFIALVVSFAWFSSGFYRFGLGKMMMMIMMMMTMTMIGKQVQLFNAHHQTIKNGAG